MWILGWILNKIRNLNNRIISRFLLHKIVHGKKCHIEGGDFSVNNITLGDNVFIGKNANFLSSNAKIKIGNDVMIASHCSIITGNHRIDVIGKRMDEVVEKRQCDDEDVVIEDDVWIGYGVTILKGVTIGHGSVVGACSVVTKSIPPYSVYTGIPALRIRERFSQDQIVLHKQLLGGKQDE